MPNAAEEYSIDAQTDSWLPGWKYRKSHNITGAAGAGTNYQIPFTVHYSNGTDSGSDVYCGENCSEDFSDIRYTGSDEFTLLDYWIETYTPSDSAKIWVEVSENLNHSATVYMYYGNDFATSESNGEATCVFYEDFSAPFNSTKWNHTERLPTFEQGEGNFIVEAGYTWDPLAIATPYELPDRGYRLRTKMKFNTIDNFNARHSYFGFGYSNIGTYGINGVICIDITDENTDIELHTVGDEDFDFFGVIGQPHFNYKEYELIVEPFGLIRLSDGTNTVSGTLTYDISLRPSIGVVVNGAYNGNYIRTTYDYYWITKWQPVEPQHAQWGNVTESPYTSDDTSPIVDFSFDDFEFEPWDWNATTVSWNVTEENPFLYEIYVNGMLAERSVWVDDVIVYSFDRIEEYVVVTLLGSHNITLHLIDLNLNTATDEVIVTFVDTTPPLIYPVEDIVMEQGDRSFRIEWVIEEVFPHYYSVRRSGTVIMSGFQTTDTVLVNLDTLNPGNYTFSLNVEDSSGNNATDYVNVLVLDPYIITTDTDSSITPGGNVFPTIDLATIVLFGIGFVFIVGICLLLKGNDIPEMQSGYTYG
ncbi:MAG: DUF2341 domain-containing protein [Candidatus Thorarchaeota archaeon]|jgi:hypothetical protein